MVTDYLQTSSGTCRYSYNKLKDVLYLVSAEHIKDVQIDNGEAYISGLTELPLRINGFDIQFTEETSLDERYKFQKKITLSMNGYVNYKLFGGRYYAILEAEDGTYFMVNVDFPSRITHTFNLSKDVNQTDFTFACLSNFPTLKLDAEFEAVEPVCLGFRVNGIQSLQLIEKEKARLDVENKTVISTEDFKKIEYLGDSCSFSEVYDGFKVTDTIEFQIALDAYKPSWQYSLLEFLDNKYSAIIIPKGNDNKFYPGFNFGLEPSYVISTASQKGESDIITVTLTESSSYGTTAAVDWDEDQSTETRWRWVKQVGDTICYECIGLRRARYLVRQQVDMFGNPTGDYQVMEGYESQYPNFHIVGTFTTEQEFDSLDCDESGACDIISNMPNTIIFNSATCNTYTLRTSCAFEFKNIPANITVSPSAGFADTDYIVTVCNSTTPTSTPSEQNMTLSCCQNNRNITIKVQTENTCVTPETQYINCLGGQVQFAYNGNCRLSITSAPGLTYSVGNNTVAFTVPRNNSTSTITYTITATNCDCSSGTTTFHIQQDKVYEQWVTEDGYICDGGNSYAVERRYTGTSSSSLNATDQTRKGTLITSGDTRCSSSETTKWEWDGVNYYCWEGDKYKAVFKYVSYDAGQTWIKTNYTRLGEMVESASTWCELPVQYKWELTDEWVCENSQYRWYPSGYTCVGFDKYQNSIKQVSLDSGTTWQNVVPEETSATTLIEANSEYCGYVPPTFEGKWIATYPSGTSSAACDSSTTLTQGEIPATGIRTVTIGNCVETIQGFNIPGAGAFYGYTSLLSVTIPDSVTTIGPQAFMWCTSLSSVTIPDSVTSIGDSAFENCSGLTSVTLPSGLTVISDSCFAQCSGLTSITIPSGVTEIGESAFLMCPECYITILTTTPPTLGDNYVFYGSNRSIYVPCESVNAYKSAWSIYASRIACIEPVFNEKWIATYTGGTTSSAECDASSAITQNEIALTNLVSVEIMDCVRRIDSSAFYGCNSLTSVTIGNSVTNIGDWAFFGCSSLTNINIGSGVTTISNHTFRSCSSLSSITIPDSVTSIGGNAFRNCSGLTGVTVNATTPPTLGNYAFDSTNNCSIFVPCSSVADYKAASGWSTYADRIEGIPPCGEPPTPTGGTKWVATYADLHTESAECDTSNAITSGEITLTNLVSVEIGSCVTGISNNAFASATILSSVTIPNSVTSIGGNAFNSCSSLSSITIPNSVTSIGNSAFNNCSGLTSVTIPDSVTNIGTNAFASCFSLTSVNIPTGLTSIPESLFDYDRHIDGTLEIPSGVTSIGNYAFWNCENLDAIICRPVVPPTAGSGIFGGSTSCPVYVPCESVDAYKAASGWSNYASRIEGIPPCSQPFNGKWIATYTGGTTSSAECDASSAITQNEITKDNLKSVEIGSCVTNIGDYAFYPYGSLTSVTIPNTVTTIGEAAFFYCYSLTGITIPDSVTYIGKDAFSDCSGLTSVNIPNSVTYIGSGAFSMCVNLTSVTIPSGITSIGNWTFGGCHSLTGSIIIPNGVTSIGEDAFFKCSGLTSVTIPSGVTSIGHQAFEYCTGLQSITILATTPPTLGQSRAFDYTNDCPIYVPSASVNAYKSASSWNHYTSRIQAIS